MLDRGLRGFACGFSFSPLDTKVTETGDHKGRPYGKVDDGLFSKEYLMRAVTLTTWNENAGGVEKGDHKGRPYGRVGDGLFS